MQSDQAQVDAQKLNLTYCRITSPVTGRVGLRQVDPGNYVQTSDASGLVVITQLQPISVIFTLPEDNLPAVMRRTRGGATLAVTAFDRAGTTKLDTGRLDTIDNQIDTTTGTVKMRALFDNKNNSLFPNQFVNTRLRVKTLQGVTLIPSSAIQRNGQTAFVYLIQNNTAQIRNIKPGVTDAGQTAVEGINPGDVVANSSFEKLQSNSKIVVAKQAPASANANEETAP